MPSIIMQPELTLEELKQLISEAEASGSKTVEFAGYRMHLCVKIGRALNAYKKAIGHGNWMAWVEKNLEGTTVQTARKWIKLSEAVDRGHLNLDEAKGVRHAYILAGLLPEPEDSPASSHVAPVNYLVHLDRFESALRAIELDKLQEGELRQLTQRLKPVAELYEQILIMTPP